MPIAFQLERNDHHVAQSKGILQKIEESDLTGDLAQQFGQEPCLNDAFKTSVNPRPGKATIDSSY